MFLSSSTERKSICTSYRRTVIAFTLILGLAAPHYSQARDCSGTVLLLGDSIGAGYGLSPGASWADMLGMELETLGLNWVNASVSGATTAGGLRRLQQLLDANKPRWVILELGGNDGLRGFPIKRMRNNLRSMVTMAQNSGAAVYILGMRIPPNYGPVYTRQFHAAYKEVAHETSSAYLPFLLDGIGEDLELMQADGIHPTAEAQQAILETAKTNMPDFCTSS